MDSAPLPPHERTWRHPSEVGASAPAVEPGRVPRGLALAGSALAVVMVATMVVALTPRQNATTTAITATTVPASSLRSAANTAVVAAESIRTSRLSGITAIPNAIADIPAAVTRSAATNDLGQVVLPDLDDRVTVVTEQFVYAVAWRDVTRIDVMSDAVVVDHDGVVVARFVDGRLIVSPDLVVGASFNAD